MLDVAEDPLASARDVPHGPHGHRPEDLGRAREQPVGVFQLIVARRHTDVTREAQETGDGGPAPRRIAAVLLLLAQVCFGTHDESSSIDGEVSREE